MSMPPDSKKTVLCLMGTTATGKTDIAIELFEKFPLEIISVDSAMVYRGMNIGTAKPDEELLRKVPHHLIDIRDPAESFSVSDFTESALELIKQIHQRGKIPLLVGGTLLYFRALLSGLSQLPSANPAIRKVIEDEAREKGWAAMHEQLAGFDPVSADKIHPNDPQRLQRAIEVYRLAGTPMSRLQAVTDKTVFPWQASRFALVADNRQWLHQRIADRFTTMLEQGFVEEVQNLYSRSDLHTDLPAMRSVGYRQVWQYLDGKLSASEMKEKAVIATRQLAKRQHTWLRSETDIQLFDPEKMSMKQILSELNSAIKMIDVL